MPVSPVESHLELLIIEGEDKGESYPLTHASIELGRRQTDEVKSENRIGFSEPTVSGIHAALVWSAKDLGYQIEHHSKTNPTFVNSKEISSSQLLKEGDLVQMGRLVAKLVPSVGLASPTEVSSEPGFCLLVMTGPEKGEFHAIPPVRTVLRSPGQDQSSHDLPIGGLVDSQIEIITRQGRMHIKPLNLSNTLKVYEAWPGVLLEHTLQVGKSFVVKEGSLIACGVVGFSLGREADTTLRRNDLMGGKAVHPGVTHVTPPGTHSFLFTGPQEDTIRVLAGPLRNEKFWLTPVEFTAPFRLGKSEQADYTIKDPQMPDAELTWGDSGLTLKNLDESLSIGLNTEEIPPGSERNLCSGDRFKLGSSEFIFECATIQYHLGKVALRFDDEDMPFLREISVVGSGTHADFFVNADELAEAHGRLRVTRRGTVIYHHLDANSSAQIGETTIKAGEEHPLAKGEHLILAPNLSFELVQAQ